MAKKTLILQLLPGQHMVWTVVTETPYPVEVSLKDDLITYAHVKNSAKDFFAQFGHDYIQEKGLCVEITIDTPNEIKTAESCGNFIAENGDITGYTRCYAFEAGEGNAYKDLIFSIFTHKTQ